MLDFLNKVLWVVWRSLRGIEVIENLWLDFLFNYSLIKDGFEVKFGYCFKEVKICC